MLVTINWRWITILVMHLSWMVTFSQRFNLTLAIVPITNRDYTSKTLSSGREASHAWTELDKGNALASFYYGYVSTQFIGGYISDKVGGKHLIGTASFIGNILTILTPTAVEKGLYSLIALRVILGMSQGLVIPALLGLISNWSSKSTVNCCTELVLCGTQIAILFTSVISYLSFGSRIFHGWPGLFYFQGILGFATYLNWMIFVYNKPSDHPWISEEEIKLLENKALKRPQNIPWKKFFTNPAVIANYIAMFGYFSIR